MMFDSCPESQSLTPGWKCEHFPHGKAVLADYKWDSLAAVNIDGYSLKNDFKVAVSSCLPERRMGHAALQEARRAFIDARLLEPTGKMRRTSAVARRYPQCIKQSLESVLDFEFTKCLWEKIGRCRCAVLLFAAPITHGGVALAWQLTRAETILSHLVNK